jgi:hypothetical protein
MYSRDLELLNSQTNFRIFDHQPCVRKALFDKNSDLKFTDDEMTLSSQVRNKFHPITV